MYDGGGTMAVAFFFVLGGFVMTLGYKDKVTIDDFNYKQYLIRRCVKFYPLHWLCILSIIPLTWLSFSWIDIPKLFLNAALLHTWVPIQKWYFSFNSVSWYLSNTMFFAVVFPFFFKWISGASYKGRVTIAVKLAVVYVIVALLIPEERHHAILYISPYMRLMDFVFGIFLALGYLILKERSSDRFFTKSNNTVSQFAIIALIVVLVAESCILPEHAKFYAPVYWIPQAFLIVIATLSEQRWGGQKWLQNRWLQRLGELSFVIFMVHQIILSYTNIIIDKILHFENNIIYVVFTLSMTIVVSIVVDKYILKPITQWLTKRNQPSMTARS